MSKAKLLQEIELYVKGLISYEALSAAVEDYSSALLRQTACYAALKILEQELNKEQKAAGAARFERDYGTHVTKANGLSYAIKVIKESQANAA